MQGDGKQEPTVPRIVLSLSGIADVSGIAFLLLYSQLLTPSLIIVTHAKTYRMSASHSHQINNEDENWR